MAIGSQGELPLKIRRVFKPKLRICIGNVVFSGKISKTRVQEVRGGLIRVGRLVMIDKYQFACIETKRCCFFYELILYFVI